MRKKYRDRSGASVVFALFGLMIAAMVSMVLVSAAWMNANRAASLKDSEQAYLLVSSVADVVYEAVADTRTEEDRLSPDENSDGPAFVLERSETEVEVETASGAIAAETLYLDTEAEAATYRGASQRKGNLSFKKLDINNSTLKNVIRKTVRALAVKADIAEVTDASRPVCSQRLDFQLGDHELSGKMVFSMYADLSFTVSISSGSDTAGYKMVMRCYPSQTKSVRTKSGLILAPSTEGDIVNKTALRKITDIEVTYPSDMISAQKGT